MTTFLNEMSETKKLTDLINLCENNQVPFEQKNLTDNIVVIKIKNTDMSKLTYGIKYGKKGEFKVYYINNCDVLLISNGYGFSGRGDPVRRSTFAKIVTESTKDLVCLLNKKSDYYGKTVREMEKIIKDFYSIKSETN